jgi:hypothetical protein
MERTAMERPVMEGRTAESPAAERLPAPMLMPRPNLSHRSCHAIAAPPNHGPNPSADGAPLAPAEPPMRRPIATGGSDRHMGRLTWHPS